MSSKTLKNENAIDKDLVRSLMTVSFITDPMVPIFLKIPTIRTFSAGSKTAKMKLKNIID